MSAAPIDGSNAAGAQALEPAAVKDGSPAVKQAYSEALSFESVLVNQLCEQLVSSSGLDSSGSGDGDGDSSGSGLGAFAGLLPGALASSIMNDGGLGLASQLLPSFEAEDAESSGTAGS
jgi:hypothetical protein